MWASLMTCWAAPCGACRCVCVWGWWWWCGGGGGQGTLSCLCACLYKLSGEGRLHSGSFLSLWSLLYEFCCTAGRGGWRGARCGAAAQVCRRQGIAATAAVPRHGSLQQAAVLRLISHRTRHMVFRLPSGEAVGRRAASPCACASWRLGKTMCWRGRRPPATWATLCWARPHPPSFPASGAACRCGFMHSASAGHMLYRLFALTAMLGEGATAAITRQRRSCLCLMPAAGRVERGCRCYV